MNIMPRKSHPNGIHGSRTFAICRQQRIRLCRSPFLSGMRQRYVSCLIHHPDHPHLCIHLRRFYIGAEYRIALDRESDGYARCIPHVQHIQAQAFCLGRARDGSARRRIGSSRLAVLYALSARLGHIHSSIASRGCLLVDRSIMERRKYTDMRRRAPMLLHF